MIISARGRVGARPLPQVPMEMASEPQPKFSSVDGWQLTTVPCPHGCGTAVVLAQYGKREFVLDPAIRVFAWMDRKADGSPWIVGQPSNWLAEHICPQRKGGR